jgi:hypothetical protein
MTDERAVEVAHVSQQDYVATCQQDGAKARGTVRELVEHGWVYTPPGDRTAEGGWFCPGCVMQLDRAGRA